MRSRLVLCMLAIAAPAHAFTAFSDPSNHARPVRWNTASVSVEVQQDGVDDVTDGTDVAAMEAAVRTWNTALGGTLGITSSRGSSRGYGRDGVNRVVFVESDWPAAADGALGTTIPHVEEGNPSRFVDADVLLNGTLSPWTTRGDPRAIDVASVATHELGHLLGLWHAWDERSTMYTGTRRGSTFRAVLHDDDERGARFLASASASCTTDDDCPLLVSTLGGGNTRLRCSGGTCSAGSASYGAECVASSQCSSNSCLADRVGVAGSDPGACTRSCAGGATCPDGDACVDTGGGEFCAPGRSCFVDADCGGGPNDRCLLAFDGAYRCARLCARDANCSNGARCVDLGYGAGVCAVPGPTPDGSPCLHALECAGLACVGAPNRTCADAPPNSPLDGMMPADAGTTARDASMPDAATPLPDAALPPPPPGLDDGSTPEQDTCTCATMMTDHLPWSAAVLLAAFLVRRRRRG